MWIQLTPKQQGGLERLVRGGKTEVRKYRRAEMVLLADQGVSVKSIARRLGTNRSLVKKWLGRFRGKGLPGLDDLPRSGRPQRVQCLERTQVVAAALSSARTVWLAACTVESFGSERGIG